MLLSVGNAKSTIKILPYPELNASFFLQLKQNDLE